MVLHPPDCGGKQKQNRPMKVQAEHKTDELITGEELARLLKVSRRCLTNWINARIIPCIRIGRVLRFHPELPYTHLQLPTVPLV